MEPPHLPSYLTKINDFLKISLRKTYDVIKVIEIAFSLVYYEKNKKRR